MNTLQKDILVSENESIKNALKKLDKSGEKILLVTDNAKRLMGTITDGDIRRHILNGKNLEDGIQEAYNRKPTHLRKGSFSMKLVKNMLIKDKIGLLPIVDKKNKVVDFITWNQVFADGTTLKTIRGAIRVPVVIMAGGKSTRLEPFTKIFPKPLIPIGEKPIVEIIIDEFGNQGVRHYYLILNYKGELIESYFNNIEKDYKIEYIWERNFYGTIGGLKLLENKINDIFIVSNCDVIVNTSFDEVINFHKEHAAELTILSSFQHHKIPYGVVKFEEGGRVTDILEKPEYTFTVNAGVYILNKEVLQLIPKNKYFDMTDLIKVLIKNEKKVFTYPVNENDYIDVGQWDEYKKAIEKLQL